MIELLEGVFEETGILPDLVLSGHVHNYQRFQKIIQMAKHVTYLVAGAGGYDELHSLATPEDSRFTSNSQLFTDVSLQAYNDNHHGFLKLSIQRESEHIVLTGKYFVVDRFGEFSGSVADGFEIRID